MTRCLALPLAAMLILGAGDAPRSGYDDASPAVRAMQDDDAANPGFLWVAQGEALWSQPAGPAGKSCASCHGEAADSMRGVAARYPVVDPHLNRPVTLDQRIEQCRVGRQGASPLPAESDARLALAVFVGLQSRGQPMAVAADGAAQPFLQEGRRLFETRMGQFNLSCAQCHDGLAGQRLAGSTIPQGHPNGYPEYRLEWQGMGSLHRRIRNCTTGVRAEPIDADSPAFAALALYLGWRASGLRVETPAVRP
ncbi:MAG: sulfur oxidation c-type cytochrome SoxA [Acetobacteraceae bacterium]